MLGFSPFSSAPLSALQSPIGKVITESVSAADSIIASINSAEQTITETVTASETESNVIATDQSITETGTASETENATYNPGGLLTETVTASETESTTYIPGGLLTETVTANHTNTTTATTRASLTNISAFVNSISNITSAVGNTLLAAYSGRGLRFISNKTAVLGNIGIPAYKVITQNGAPTTTGTIEVWQLTSNSLTSSPSTLLVSKTLNYSDLPCPLSSIAPITNSLLGSTGLTQYVSATVDDGNQALTIPWSVNYLGTTYSTVYVGSNSYLTFGTGVNTYSPLNPVSPSVPKICISSADNSYQQVFAGIEGTAPNRTYRIRYEGTAATTGTVGSPTMVWEMVLYENNISQIDIQIGANARGSGGSLHGIYTSDAQVGLLTDAAGTTTYTNIGWRIVSSTTPLNSKSITYFDLSSSNITLNSGTAYLVGIRSGSDWATTTKQVYGIYSFNNGAYGVASSNPSPASGSVQFNEYSYFYPNVYYPVATSSSAWTSFSSDTVLYSFSVYSTTDFFNTIDSVNGGFLATVSATENDTSATETENATYNPGGLLTETVTASETEIATYNLGGLLTETGTASETETTIATRVSDITETGTASETEINSLVTDQTVTENTNISAVDAETGASIQIQYRNETGSASETETSQADFYPTITETGTASETETQVVSSTRGLTENDTSASETESNSATRVSDITETGTASETETQVVSSNRALTETGTASETETNIATRLTDLTETVTASETESNSATRVSDITETGTANDPNILGGYTVVRDITETGNASETETNISTRVSNITETGTASETESTTAIRLAELIETITATELTSAQAAFISAIQEALNAIDNNINNIISTSSISEIVSALDSPNRFAFYAGNISELLNAVDYVRTDIPAFITETNSPTSIELANSLVNKGVLETVNPNDSEIYQLIATSYITEIIVAGEQTVVWLFFPMDYELVSSRYSSLIEVDSDQIYADNIDVFYLDASKIMVGMDVSFDQIYVDNVDVLYGNIAIIDDIVSDEIYI